MNNIETMKLALEAFDRMVGRKPEFVEQAITALRQAIEQAQEQEPVVWMYQDKSTHEMRFQKHMSEFVDHSKTSEVPLYGEPLANHELQCVCGAVWCGDEMVHLPNKTPPRQPEPVIDKSSAIRIATALGWTPPRQPLTDEEIAEFAERMEASDPTDSFWREFARAIEAAHGIKGEA